MMLPLAILLAVLAYVNYSRAGKLKEQINTEQDLLKKEKLSKRLKTTNITYKILLSLALINVVAYVVFPLLS